MLKVDPIDLYKILCRNNTIDRSPSNNYIPPIPMNITGASSQQGYLI